MFTGILTTFATTMAVFRLLPGMIRLCIRKPRLSSSSPSLQLCPGQSEPAGCREREVSDGGGRHQISASMEDVSVYHNVIRRWSVY